MPEPAIVLELNEALVERDRLRDLLVRLRQWDAWTVADQWPLADAPYWRDEIDRALAGPVSDRRDDGE